VVLLLAPGTEAKEFQPMTVNAKAGLRHDSCPERIDITAGEFRYRPALHADDMMPMFRAAQEVPVHPRRMMHAGQHTDRDEPIDRPEDGCSADRSIGRLQCMVELLSRKRPTECDDRLHDLTPRLSQAQTLGLQAGKNSVLRHPHYTPKQQV
jgi:hypothetical protein